MHQWSLSGLHCSYSFLLPWFAVDSSHPMTAASTIMMMASTWAFTDRRAATAPASAARGALVGCICSCRRACDGATWSVDALTSSVEVVETSRATPVM